MRDAKRFLVPFDFSPESRHALKAAVAIARRARGGKVVLAHVLPEIEQLLPVPWIDPDKTPAGARTAKALRASARAVPPALLGGCVVGRGPVAVELDRLCRAARIDLVVMETHARRGLRRLAHPSVTEAVVRTVSRPVLVLKRGTGRRGSPRGGIVS